MATGAGRDSLALLGTTSNLRVVSSRANPAQGLSRTVPRRVLGTALAAAVPTLVTGSLCRCAAWGPAHGKMPLTQMA